MSRVLLIHQNFVSGKQPGNARAMHTVAGLQRSGFKVDVITGQGSYLEDADSAAAVQDTIEREGDLTIMRLGQEAALGQRGRSYLRFMRRAWQCSRRLERVDLVYATSPPLPQLLLNMIVSARRRAPMILEVRDIWPAAVVELGLLNSKLMIKAMEWIEAAAYRYCERCVSVSPPFSEYLRRMGLAPDGGVVIPTGGDPEYAVPDQDGARQWCRERGIDAGFLAVYCGSFNEAYQIPRMTQAAALLASSRPDIHWAFAGNGRDREHVERAAAEHENIHYLGRLPRDEIRQLLWSADCGIVSLLPRPHMETVIPGKLPDYMAAGLPVISLIDGQTGVIVRAARAGLVCAPEPEKIREALVEMADLPAAERKATGERGRRWVLEHMDAARLADAFAAEVRAVQGAARRPGFGRLLAALLSAGSDVLRGRARRAEQEAFGATRQETVETSFARWLDWTEKIHSARSDFPA